MGRIVIAVYKPKEGRSAELRELMRTHVPRLREQGLVTDRASIVMEAADGTVVEVFEWKSEEAIEAAHSNAEVAKMWAEYSEVCEYMPLANLAEAKQLFSEFTPLEGVDA